MRAERLYRFFDAEGRLLYVGITANLPKRLEKHSLREWWECVANMTVTPYATREEVRAAWFSVERARTAHHLLDWTLHLTEKCWLEDTDWSDFIRTALAANNAQVDA